MGVAIVGSTVRDVVHLPGRAPARSTGGSPLFAARALSALGVRPGVATRCDDAALAAPIAELADPLCLRLDATVVQSELRYRDGRRARPHAGRPRRGLERGRHHRLGGARAERRDLGARRHAARRRPRAGGAGGAGRAAGAPSRSTRRARCDAPRSARSCSAGRSTPRCCEHVQALKLSEHEALAAYGTIDAGAIRAAVPGAGGARHVRLVGRRALLRGRLGAGLGRGRDRRRPDGRRRRVPRRLRARARAGDASR